MARLYANENFPLPAGIIVCTFTNFERQAQQIHEALEAQPTLPGELLRINRPAA